MSVYAVYLRALSYNDEHFYIDGDSELEQALDRWRGGNPKPFQQLFAQLSSHSDYPDEVISVHDTKEDASAAARDAHREQCRQLTFIDMGFHSYGCAPNLGEDTDGDEREWRSSDEIDDIDRLRAWCEHNDVAMPLLEDARPETRTRIEAIVAASKEGDLWLDYLEDDGVEPFAADLVVAELRATARDDLIDDLWRHLVCDLAYVGPAPDPPRHRPKTAEGRSGEMLSRLFKRK